MSKKKQNNLNVMWVNKPAVDVVTIFSLLRLYLAETKEGKKGLCCLTV